LLLLGVYLFLAVEKWQATQLMHWRKRNISVRLKDETLYVSCLGYWIRNVRIMRSLRKCFL
jgi:hypothetical protein